jgi:hypothetical protein
MFVPAPDFLENELTMLVPAPDFFTDYLTVSVPASIPVALLSTIHKFFINFLFHYFIKLYLCDRYVLFSVCSREINTWLNLTIFKSTTQQY